MLSPSSLPAASIYVVHQVIIYGLSAVLVFFSVEAYDRHLRELSNVSAELADYAQLLEQSNGLLERAQAVARVGSWTSDISADQIALSVEGSHTTGVETDCIMSYHDWCGRLRQYRGQP